jgi:hypothetical protein
LNGATNCNTTGNRPVCHQIYELGFYAPARVLSREGHKHRYTYFGLALSPSKEPPPPKVLKLVKDFSYGSLVKVSSSEYKVSLHFSFEVGTDGYYFAFDVCTKNTESVDGIGLPGHHGCGGNQVSFNSKYLG